MDEKWKVRRIGKECYLKIHIALDIKTKEILALDVTDEKVHDDRLLKKLVDHVLNTTSLPLYHYLYEEFNSLLSPGGWSL
ncbi:MAG TPA: transposase [Candidatus Nitrosocosmicus sp.]|nr:transposase [Candidatus Nitrosocosmicus sp.]